MLVVVILSIISFCVVSVRYVTMPHVSGKVHYVYAYKNASSQMSLYFYVFVYNVTTITRHVKPFLKKLTITELSPTKNI
jgi:hypothetical protein